MDVSSLAFRYPSLPLQLFVRIKPSSFGTLELYRSLSLSGEILFFELRINKAV